MYEVLIFNLYWNLTPSLFFLSSRGVSFASKCRASAGEVLKAHVYILMPSLLMLSSFYLTGEAVFLETKERKCFMHNVWDFLRT